MIMRQLHEGRADIEIAYARGVMPEGNPVALAAIDEVFETCTALWRGLGEIPGSGYRIREEFAQFDAVRRFQPDVEPTQDPKGCRCGDVLRGIVKSNESSLVRRYARENQWVLAWCPAKAAAPRTTGTTKEENERHWHPKDVEGPSD